MEIVNIKEKPEFLREVVTLEHDEWASNKNDNRDERIELKYNKVRNLLNNKNFCKLILIDNNMLVGFVSIFPEDAKECPELTPWYATMYVKKEYRGKGYSKILNNAILKEAKKRGYKEIYLKTELTNYYEKFGAIYVKNINKTEKLFKFIL